MLVKQPAIEIQRRQCVITQDASGALTVTVRWDQQASNPWPFPTDYGVEQAKRYCAEVQLGRAPHEVDWTSNQIDSKTVWYSDTFLTTAGGEKPTREQIDGYRAQCPKPHRSTKA